MWRRVDLVWTDVSQERIAFHLQGKYVSPKRRFTKDLHNATTQKTEFFCNYKFKLVLLDLGLMIIK
jgi:hypothetical protein